MYTDKKVMLGAVCGLILGLLFMYIYADSIKREKEMVEIRLSQVENVHKHLQRAFDYYKLDMQDYETAVYDRGKLSDILRCHYDQCHWDGHSEFSLDSLCECFGVDKDSVRLWSYSYSY